MLCEARPATRQGEHVLPQWYLRDLDLVGPPPFAWSKGKEPIKDRRGRQIHRSERTRVLLPACRQCNAELDRRFEKPGKLIMRRLFSSRGEVSLTVREAAVAGLWFTKTLLLLAHPKARYGDDALNKHALRWTATECPAQTFYRWLIDGSQPPDGLSLWLHRTNEKAEDPGATEFTVPLPEVTADGCVTEYVSFLQSFHGLHVALVVHPGWRLVHPLHADGRASQLLPHTGDANLLGLPELPRRTVGFVRCRITLRNGALGSSALPALEASPLGVPFPNEQILRCSF